MATAAEIRDAAVAVLKASGLVPENRVYASRDIVLSDKIPVALSVYLHEEKATGEGGAGEPNFKVELTLMVDGRVSDPSFAKVEQTVDLLWEGVKEALLSNAGFVSMVEGITSFQVASRFSAENNIHLADVAMGLTLRYSAVFPPNITQDLAGITVKLDALWPFDAAGTYPNPVDPAYAVLSASRPTGPDGRVETQFQVAIPTT